MMLQALIFDVDGTIADTERDGHRVAFNRAFAEAGLDWDWSPDLYGDLLTVAGGKERIQHYIHTYQPSLPVIPDLPSWAAQLHRAKTHHYQHLLQAGTMPLRPGVRRLIQSARSAGVRLAIATTSALDNVLALLETSLSPDSPDWFELIAAGDIVPAKKPAPDVYNYVLETLALRPDQCLVIEDSEAGMTAARSAQLPTVITCNSYTQAQDFTGAALVLEHLGELDCPAPVRSGTLAEASYFTLATAERILHDRQAASLNPPYNRQGESMDDTPKL